MLEDMSADREESRVRASNAKAVKGRAMGVALGLVIAATAGGVLAFDEGDAGSGLDAAVISVLVRSVERDDEAGEFHRAVSGDEVTTGRTVRTDHTGRAQLGYEDGSLARLGPNTEFRLTSVRAGEGERRVSGELDVGQTWHRVSDLSGNIPEDSYVVETAVASASVRGTAFSVVCLVPNTCTFTVQEGEVEVVTDDGERIVLGPGETVTVTEDDMTDPETLSPDELRSDPWIDENLRLDAEQDDDDAGPPSDDEVASALIEGTWDVAAVTTSSPGGERDGEELERRYDFAVDDCADAPCDLVVAAETGDGEVEVPVEFSDGAYRFSTSFDIDCGDLADALTTTITWTFEVTEAERDGGAVKATAIAGTVVETQQENAASDCRASRLEHDLTGTRS